MSFKGATFVLLLARGFSNVVCCFAVHVLIAGAI